MQVSLIEFSVENYKIFKEKATFSMLARKNDEYTFESNGEHLLKTSLIYGPNASGKTTILDAFDVMSRIMAPFGYVDNALPYAPFMFSEDSKDKPAAFEVTLSFPNDKVLQYSFSYNDTHIVSETLNELLPDGKKVAYFSRENNEITLGKTFGNDLNKELVKRVEEEKRSSLFLTVSSQFGGISDIIIKSVFENINVISAIDGRVYENYTIKRFDEDENFKSKVLGYLKSADFSINDSRTEKIVKKAKDSSLSEKVRVFFSHSFFNSKNEKVTNVELPYDAESIGTQQFFAVLGPVVDTLEKGKVLLIDEFDNSLHPLLTKFIVDLFESEKTNSHNAQLIVTTHDTSLLSYKYDFIKDQFWFTEKDEFGAAKLFSLAEFDTRNDTEYAKKYLEGRFGALPFIESINK